MSIVVLCAGGHARVIIEALRSCGIAVAALTDCDPARKGAVMSKVEIIGNDDAAAALPAASTELANGLGNRATRGSSGLTGRRTLFDRFSVLGYRFPVITHATSVLASDAELGEGAQVLAAAVVQPAAMIGRNVIINTGAIVEHDCKVGDHSHIGPGAVLCGGITIGALVHIGANATVLNGVRIGDGAVVGAGAVVAADIPDGGFAGTETPR